ncbi:MAG: hypothetical protein AAF441_14825 [Pseudomonadota bacterium]
MDWLKQYGLSVVGAIAGGVIAAHAGYNMGVEARTGWTAPDSNPAAIKTAKLAQTPSSARHHSN